MFRFFYMDSFLFSTDIFVDLWITVRGLAYIILLKVARAILIFRTQCVKMRLKILCLCDILVG